MKSFDLIVIGGGPGGYVAAIRASQKGLKAVLIDKTGLGGTCLHRGCIPSKAYLAAAEMIEVSRRAAKLGIHFDPPRIDYSALVSSKDQKVGKLSQGIAGLLKGNGIEVIQGEATLSSRDKVLVAGEEIQAKHVLLATGTEPTRPAGFPFDSSKVITTDELFLQKTLPRRLLVIGGGVSGSEMACAYNLLGSEVTIVELLPDLLPQEGGLASRTLKGILEKRGIKVKTGTKVEKLEKNGAVTAVLGNGERVEVDLALVAIGRRVGEDRLGLAKVGIAVERGFVKVNDRMETSVSGVYAIGDLVGTTLLAHGAMAEGICAAENIAGHPTKMDYLSIPRVTYTIPEVASVGKKEAELKAGGVTFKAGRFSYLASGKALLHEEAEGSAEIYVGSDEKVLGAVIIGAHAADMIQEVVLVMKNNLPVTALTQAVHSHPSLSEIIHEAAEDSQGLAIHKIGRRG